MYILYVTVDMIKLINDSEFFYSKNGILLHHLVNGIQQCWKSELQTICSSQQIHFNINQNHNINLVPDDDRKY